MKILLINGSPHLKGCVNEALTEIETVFDSLKVSFEKVWIGNGATHGCIDCNYCRAHHHCVFQDDIVNGVIEKMSKFDGMIIGSPVYYAGPNGTLQAMLDRIFHAMDKKKCTIKAGAAIVSCRRGGASACFDRLNKYFTIYQIPVVSSTYWNSVYGNNPEEVRQDLEGMKTMRVLAKNMYYMLSSFEKSDIEKTEEEPPVYTKFIR